MKWAIFWVIHNSVMQPVDTGLSYDNLWACMDTASIVEMAASESIHQERTGKDPVEHKKLFENRLYIYKNSVAFRTSQSKYFCVAQAEKLLDENPSTESEEAEDRWFFKLWR